MKKNIKFKPNKSKIDKRASGGALSGLLSGAAAGLSVGSVIGPLGGLAGGLIGGIGGLIFGNKAEEKQRQLIERERQRILNQKLYDFTKALNNKIQQDYFSQYGDTTGITMFDVGGVPYNPNYMLVSKGEGLDNGYDIKTVKGRGGKHEDNIIKPVNDTEYVWSNYNVPGTDITFSKLAKSIDDMFKKDLNGNDKLSMSTLDRKKDLKDRLKFKLRQQQDQMLLSKGGNKTKTVDSTSIPQYNFGGIIGNWLLDNFNGNALSTLMNGVAGLINFNNTDYNANGLVDPNTVNPKNPYGGYMMQPTPNKIQTFDKGGKVKVQKHDVVGPVNTYNKFGRHLWDSYTSDGMYGVELPNLDVYNNPTVNPNIDYNPVSLTAQLVSGNGNISYPTTNVQPQLSTFSQPVNSVLDVNLFNTGNTASVTNGATSGVGNNARNGYKLQEGIGLLGQLTPTIYSLLQSNRNPEIEPYEGNQYESTLVLPRKVDRTPLYNQNRQRLQLERYNARQLSPGLRLAYNLELYNRLMQEYNNINMQLQAADNLLGLSYDQMLLGLGEQNRGERIRVNTANAQNRLAVRNAGARAAENVGTLAKSYTQNVYQNRNNDILTPSLLLNLEMALTTDEYNKLLKLIGG